MTLTLASRTLQAPDGNLEQKQMANLVTNLKKCLVGHKTEEENYCNYPNVVIPKNL